MDMLRENLKAILNCTDEDVDRLLNIADDMSKQTGNYVDPQLLTNSLIWITNKEKLE